MSVILPILQGVSGAAGDAPAGRSGNILDSVQSSQSGEVSGNTQADSSGQAATPASNAGLVGTSNSVTLNSITTKAVKAGIPWPSPLMPVPFWMLVSNGHGWGWAFAANNAANGAAMSKLPGNSASSQLATYL